jgi:hypothetical protein
MVTALLKWTNFKWKVVHNSRKESTISYYKGNNVIKIEVTKIRASDSELYQKNKTWSHGEECGQAIRFTEKKY